MLRWFPNSKLLLHASQAALAILNSSKLPPVVDAADLIVFKLSIKQSEIQNPAVCLKPPPYHHNVFTFTLFLPEGRAGVAWEPSNKNDALSLSLSFLFLGFKALIHLAYFSSKHFLLISSSPFCTLLKTDNMSTQDVGIKWKV
jgi:hypothetical protein